MNQGQMMLYGQLHNYWHPKRMCKNDYQINKTYHRSFFLTFSVSKEIPTDQKTSLRTSCLEDHLDVLSDKNFIFIFTLVKGGNLQLYIQSQFELSY